MLAVLFARVESVQTRRGGRKESLRSMGCVSKGHGTDGTALCRVSVRFSVAILHWDREACSSSQRVCTMLPTR